MHLVLDAVPLRPEPLLQRLEAEHLHVAGDQRVGGDLVLPHEGQQLRREIGGIARVELLTFEGLQEDRPAAHAREPVLVLPLNQNPRAAYTPARTTLIPPRGAR